jgi:hypothetical protein
MKRRTALGGLAVLAALALGQPAIGGPALPALPNKTQDGMLDCKLDANPLKGLDCLNQDLKFIPDWDERNEQEHKWHRDATAAAVALAQKAWTLAAKPPDGPYVVALRIATYRVHPSKASQPYRQQLCGYASASLDQACRLQRCGQVADRSRIEAAVTLYGDACGGTAPASCSAPPDAACTAAYSKLAEATNSYAARIDALKIVPEELAGPGHAALGDFEQALLAQRGYVDTQLDAAKLDDEETQKHFVSSVGAAEFRTVTTVDSVVMKSVTPKIPTRPEERKQIANYKATLDAAKAPTTPEQYNAFKSNTKVGPSILLRSLKTNDLRAIAAPR